MEKLKLNRKNCLRLLTLGTYHTCGFVLIKGQLWRVVADDQPKFGCDDFSKCLLELAH